MKFNTSETEIKHLMVAWLAISLAFAILLNRGIAFNSGFLFVMLASALSVGVGFLLHELAHKAVAQRYGCFAEFRADFQMLIFSILVAFLGFIIAAPGAVYIQGYVSRKQNGIISAAGPVTNILLSFLFMALLFLFPTDNAFLNLTLRYGMLINAWLAAFNMIPFGNIDGAKVLPWNKTVYFLTLGAGVALVFASYLVLPQ